MSEELKKFEGKLNDLQFQLKDFRDYHSPFNMEQIASQVEGLNNRTLTINDRVKCLEDGLRNLTDITDKVERLAERASSFQEKANEVDLILEKMKEVKDEGDKPAPVEVVVEDKKDILDAKPTKKSKGLFKKS